MSAREAALEAMNQVLRDNALTPLIGILPEIFAAGLDAYMEASAPPSPETVVRLLRPAPGDTVVWHLEATAWEADQFMQQLQPLCDKYPGVLFMVAERVDQITVVRPETDTRDGLERLRDAHERLEAKQLREDITRDQEGEGDGD